MEEVETKKTRQDRSEEKSWEGSLPGKCKPGKKRLGAIMQMGDQKSDVFKACVCYFL